MNNIESSDDKYLRTILDAFPSPVFIIDHTLHIIDANQAALEFVEKKSDLTNNILCGNILKCVNALNSVGGCGTTDNCPDCVIRWTVGEIMNGSKTFRRLSKMKIVQQNNARQVYFLVSGSLFEYENQKLAALTLENITEIIELYRIIPICSFCGKVRDEKQFWQKFVDYIAKYTDIEFSHGVCPECAKIHYPEVDLTEE